ncbi:MAG: hypothetical protein CR991_10285 [Proteobacteria bacterium]|nr:MAG: hypothetical protein CR991_10285 [Pseudomonadota bacterium]
MTLKMPPFSFVIRALVSLAWIYTGWQLISLQHSFSPLLVFVMNATLLLMVIWFGWLGWSLVERHPHFATFATIGCLLAAALL